MCLSYLNDNENEHNNKRVSRKQDHLLQNLYHQLACTHSLTFTVRGVYMFRLCSASLSK